MSTGRADLQDQEQNLLKLAYSSEFCERTWFTPALFRNLARQFGPTINNVALRHALVAFLLKMEVSLQPYSYEDFAYHSHLGVKTLRKHLDHPESVGFGDMCAAYLLSCIQAWGSQSSDVQSAPHKVAQPIKFADQHH